MMTADTQQTLTISALWLVEVLILLVCIGVLLGRVSLALASAVSNRHLVISGKYNHCSRMEKITILDLFSGTGSVKKAAALDSDFECFSLDISDKFSTPDIIADIHEWNYKEVGRGRFDIIAASVPCQMYSCARTRAAIPRDIPAANNNVECVLEIVDYFNPAVFWIENPTTGALKSQDIVQHLKRINISYCMYSDWGHEKNQPLD